MTYRFRENGQFECVWESYSKNYGKLPKKTLTGTWIRNGTDLRLRYDPQDVADQHLTLHFIDEKTVELRDADLDELVANERLQMFQKSKVRVEDYRMTATIDGNGTVTRHILILGKSPVRTKTQISATIIERQ